MTNPKRVQRPLHGYKLIPGDADGYPIRGVTYAGGSMVLGRNIDDLLVESRRGVRRNRRLLIGSMVLAAIGEEDKDIGPLFHTVKENVTQTMKRVKEVADTSQRYTLLRSALAAELLQIESYGPETNFRATHNEVFQMGMLSRGVKRTLIAGAYDTNPQTMYSDWHYLWKSEGVKKAAGGIAAAILTRQIDGMTGVPLLAGHELVDAEDWETLIKTEDPVAFKGMFNDLELAA